MIGNLSKKAAGGGAGGSSEPAKLPILTLAAVDSTVNAKKIADYICNGENDNLVFEEALQTLQGSGKLQVLEGTYTFNNTVTVAKSGITIEGQGDYTKIQLAMNCNGMFLVTGDRCTIKRIHFDGKREMQESLDKKLVESRGNFNRFSENRVVNSPSFGILVTDGVGVMVTDNYFENNRDGVNVDMNSGKGVLVQGNFTYRNTRYGIYMQKVGMGSIVGNYCMEDLVGIALVSCAVCSVVGNQAVDCGAYGVFFQRKVDYSATIAGGYNMLVGNAASLTGERLDEQNTFYIQDSRNNLVVANASYNSMLMSAGTNLTESNIGTTWEEWD